MNRPFMLHFKSGVVHTNFSACGSGGVVGGESHANLKVHKHWHTRQIKLHSPNATHPSRIKIKQISRIVFEAPDPSLGHIFLQEEWEQVAHSRNLATITYFSLGVKIGSAM